MTTAEPDFILAKEEGGEGGEGRGAMLRNTATWDKCGWWLVVGGWCNVLPLMMWPCGGSGDVM
jgi:hypothetical protein